MASAVVFVGCAGTAAIWLAYHSRPTARERDCATVKAVTHQWVSTVASIQHDLESSPGERDDLLAAADREAAMADQLRAAASRVSTPGFAEHFTTWASGAALTAQIQRQAITEPLHTDTPGPFTDQQLHATMMTNQASAALLAACATARTAPQR